MPSSTRRGFIAGAGSASGVGSVTQAEAPATTPQGKSRNPGSKETATRGASVEIRPWRELDLQTQREEYEKQRLAWRHRNLKKQWASNYVKLARALADEFGEEEVLDALEEAFWNLEFEGGKTWRAEAEEDPVAALRAQYEAQHEAAQSLTISPQDVSFDGKRYELIHYHCHLKEVFLEPDERKIGISWCMADAAAVRGFHPRAAFDFRNSQLRGDCFCYQVREIVDSPADPSEEQWSKDKSEQIGWRSVERLEA